MASVVIKLTQFSSDVQLDLCGNLWASDLELLDASAAAIINVSKADLESVFKFQTDAQAILTSSFDQIKFYVDADAWSNTIALAHLNPGNAQMDEEYKSSVLGSGSMGFDDLRGDYADNKMFLCHDYVRYLAKSLFGTVQGVDLFQNQKELLENVRKNCYDAVWSLEGASSTIGAALKKVDMNTPTDNTFALLETDTDGKYYTSGAGTDSENICRIITQQIMSSAASRFATETNDEIAIQPVPFEEGDEIHFVITMKAADTQEALTSVSSIVDHTYLIKLVVKNSPSNVAAAADEIQSRYAVEDGTA
jgi:hypothetical protein